MGCFQGRGSAAAFWMVVMVVVVSLCACRSVLATNYLVGDSSGWTIMSYDSWLSGKTFVVGDTLEFVYTSAHDVVEVTESDYASCSGGSNTVYTSGNTTYTLNSTGTVYFICTVPTHCSNGMKLAVPVEAASTSPSTPTPSTPTTPSTTPPSTSNTTTSSPPPPSTNSSPLSIPPPFSTLFLILGLFILFFHST
eukprot:c10876_g1_i1 orf=162-743(+)